MNINWSAVNAQHQQKLIDPRDLYSTLKSRKWARLRVEQSEVLENWFKRRNEPDLVIKQNTGSGKTLTGLLIAQSSLNEGIGPAAYLVPNKFLVEQVLREAADAGIPATSDFNDPRFHSCEAVFVATFQKLMNGQSRFGVRGSRKNILRLGTIVVDDAHASLSEADQIFSVRIPRTRHLYGQLLRLFETDLRYQDANALVELQNGIDGNPVRVTPWAVKQASGDILDILTPHSRDSEVPELFFSWPFIASSIDLATITFIANEIEIKLPCPDVSLIPTFRDAKRRIYLSATLADEGTLITELDASVDSLRNLIIPKRASDLGDRIIIAPNSVNSNLHVTQIREMAEKFAHGSEDPTWESEPINVVVLVPSDRAAMEWKPYADEILHAHDMHETVERLRNNNHVGLVVLVNKYDGVDLPGDACRLLVIDGVPEPLTPSQQRENAAVFGTQRFERRLVQKLEQGMGRGIRDLRDYCAVLVLGREADLALRKPESRKLFTTATFTQIQTSQQVARQKSGSDINGIAELICLFLDRDPNWVEVSLQATAEAQYSSTAQIADIDISRRQAFNFALNGDYAAAVQTLEGTIKSIDDQRLAAWYKEELSTLLEYVNPSQANGVLRAARTVNPVVIKPMHLPSVAKIKAPSSQAKQVAVFLSKKYSDEDSLRLGFESIFSNIKWGVPGTAQTAEENIKLLGEHLGFGSTMPDKESSDGGPDNLWALSSDWYAVMELKTAVVRDDPRIKKSEAEQLLHSSNWFVQKYGKDVKHIPVLFHPSAEVEPDCVPDPETRVVQPRDLSLLAKHVDDFVSDLVAENSWTDAKEIQKALKKNKLLGRTVIDSHSRSVSGKGK